MQTPAADTTVATPGPAGLQFSRHLPPRPRASLWQVEEVRATRDGQPAGFIRVSFIPRAVFDPLAADIYDYLLARNKLGTYAPGGPAARMVSLPVAALGQLAYRVQESLEGWSAANASNWPAQPEAAIRAALERWRPRIQDRFGPERDAFARFHVDKPLVDYIEVPEPLRRRGIARDLYEEAARWAAERGMALHASGTQSPAAAHLWHRLEQQGRVDLAPGPAPTDPPRRRLRTP